MINDGSKVFEGALERRVSADTVYEVIIKQTSNFSENEDKTISHRLIIAILC